MRSILVIFCFCFCFFFSCINDRTSKDVKRFVYQQVMIPQDLKAIWKGKDTVIQSFLEIPIKLVVWYDSLVCGSCEASKMFEWNEIAASADSMSQWFHIIYLFSPKKIDLFKLRMSLKADRLDYPIFIDENSLFIKQNKIPRNRQLHTFLLDKNNRVVMVGSPLHNPILWNLYKRTIQNMIVNNGVLPDD